MSSAKEMGISGEPIEPPCHVCAVVGASSPGTVTGTTQWVTAVKQGTWTFHPVARTSQDGSRIAVNGVQISAAFFPD
jgi:hypothetical protein